MHDTVSYKVSLIAVQAGALERTAGEARSREAATVMRELAAGTLAELRDLIGVLRDARDTSSSGQGREAGPGLAELPGLVRDSGLDVALDMGGCASSGPEASTPEAVSRAAYLTVQEALTNVRKHAPGAAVTVSLTRGEEAGLRVTVRNEPRTGPGGRSHGDGETSLWPDGGNGLRGLTERARQLGGTLRAGPDPDGGFSVRAFFPTTADGPDPRQP
ncbi:histidine kinase [Streptomyces thinghirensis]|nr:histidine kinase [Streptomyces thinghirensis]